MLSTQKVPKRLLPKFEAEIKMMLHASRDCMRTRWHAKQNGAGCQDAVDPDMYRFQASDGYYGEAFGVLRGMAVAGWGECSGPVNIDRPGNLRFWFERLVDDVLVEENFKGLAPSFLRDQSPSPKGTGSGICLHCLERYGRG